MTSYRGTDLGPSATERATEEAEVDEIKARGKATVDEIEYEGHGKRTVSDARHAGQVKVIDADHGGTAAVISAKRQGAARIIASGWGVLGSTTQRMAKFMTGAMIIFAFLHVLDPALALLNRTIGRDGQMRQIVKNSRDTLSEAINGTDTETTLRTRAETAERERDTVRAELIQLRQTQARATQPAPQPSSDPQTAAPQIQLDACQAALRTRMTPTTCETTCNAAVQRSWPGTRQITFLPEEMPQP